MQGWYAALTTLVLLAAPSASQTMPPDSGPPLQHLAQADQPASPPSPQPEDSKPSASMTIIDATDARGILGREVRTTADENMGRIVDVVVDRAGQVRASVIDFGGFLGVGSRKIVVDWKALRFARVANKGDSIILELTREQVRAAPEYKEGRMIVVLGASGALEPLRFINPTTPEN